MGKTLLIVAVFSWIRATFPRLRIDQIMAFSWKVMLPLSLINLTATTLEVYVLKSGGITTLELWIMAIINLVLAGVCLPLFGRLMKDKVRKSNPSGVSQSLRDDPTG